MTYRKQKFYSSMIDKCRDLGVGMTFRIWYKHRYPYVFDEASEHMLF